MPHPRHVTREPAGRTGNVYYYPSRDHRGSSSPPDDWYSSEGSGLQISRRTGPISVREVGPGQPAVANSPPSRTIYRGTDRDRAMAYVNHGRAEDVSTRNAGDLHFGRQASYWTTSERYADHCAQRASRDHRAGMVIQQTVPSRILDSAYTFDERPGHDLNETIYHNRSQLRPPREPDAVRRSRNAPAVIGPTSGRETHAFLRSAQRHRPGPLPEAEFRYEREQSSSDDPDVDQHRRGARYVQQANIQDQALQELTDLPRHTRPVRPPRRR